MFFFVLYHGWYSPRAVDIGHVFSKNITQNILQRFCLIITQNLCIMFWFGIKLIIVNNDY